MIREIIKSSTHPEELTALFKLKFNSTSFQGNSTPLNEIAFSTSDRTFCYAALSNVSRSFAVVINQLPLELRDPICIFYLVLRGLDSIEDDMNLDNETKMSLLNRFHQICYDKNWKIQGIGETEDYRTLLMNFDKVTRTFLSLHFEYQFIIADICKKMGEGMVKYNLKSIHTTEEYDEYCHFVAGLVGHGLAALFSASNIEDASIKSHKATANSMGLFLQKTNIIRDFKEDFEAGRVFWPNQIWKTHVSDLPFLLDNPDDEKSIACLNEMVLNALQHIPDSLDFMRRIRNKDVFRFCAIPQAMAIATLSKIYNNQNVFKRSVKIRKGLAAKMIFNLNNMNQLYEMYLDLCKQLKSKLNSKTDNQNILSILNKVEMLCKKGLTENKESENPVFVQTYQVH